MQEVFNNTYVTLYQADARQLPIPDESIDCVVTSPPYWGLRDYGLEDQGLGLEPTPEEYCANMVAVFREVWRVLKPTGTVWLNLGDSYSSQGGAVPEQTVRGSQNYVNRGQSGSNGIGTSRKPVSGLKPKDLVGIPWRVAFALQADGWYLRSDIIWSKPNPMPESVSDRPTKAHEYIFLLTKSPKYYYDTDAIKEEAVAERWGGHKPMNLNNTKDTNGVFKGLTRERDMMPSHRNKRSVWTVNTEPYPEAHFATYPEKLVEPCIMAGCPLGGVVLDPFAGSGTTMAVAQRLGRRGIGTDLSTEYLALASKRLGSIALPMNLGM